MYVTTFFSYKGGVGRTMALINTAYLLVEQGKRVLIVDFDLEAPGIPSFEAFRCAANRPGIVDYVCAYRDSGEAPDVGDFIVECAIDQHKSIWLLPAGRHTLPGYAEKLYSIDWQDLYDRRDGFLMFEDMRQQWIDHAASFDYVLIDSRTGYTDVGGICTRQLPDAVVIMFLPNEQNVAGLLPVVGAIRSNATSARAGGIYLHFCPSNVPDLDDEDRILAGILKAARDRLGYKRAAAVLHHYNSMDLLTQPAFTACRPNAKLTKQYRRLANAVIEHNYADEDGAVVALEKMPNRLEDAWRDNDDRELREIEVAAQQIATRHPDNGRIGWLLSILYSRMGAFEDELEALSLAIDQHYERNRATIRRSNVLSVLDRKDDALKDLRGLLGSGTATSFEILASIDLIRALDSTGWIKPVRFAIDQLQGTSESTLASFLHALMSERDKLPLAIDVGRRALQKADRDIISPFFKTQTILALIGTGQFQEAMDMIRGGSAELVATAPIADIFNYAVASWGLDGVSSPALFNLVLQRLDEAPVTRDANLYQCRALAEIVVGQIDAAKASLDSARLYARSGILQFSCWRYLEVTAHDMNLDLRAMRDAVDGKAAPVPSFFEEVRGLFP